MGPARVAFRRIIAVEDDAGRPVLFVVEVVLDGRLIHRHTSKKQPTAPTRYGRWLNREACRGS